jgi:hypothetical protein
MVEIQHHMWFTDKDDKPNDKSNGKHGNGSGVRKNYKTHCPRVPVIPTSNNDNGIANNHTNDKDDSDNYP